MQTRLVGPLVGGLTVPEMAVRGYMQLGSAVDHPARGVGARTRGNPLVDASGVPGPAAKTLGINFSLVEQRE
jgi:hypothetical protein